MAINSNNSDKEVMGGIKLWAGLTNVKVITVNPTMAELHAIDIMVKQEPNYNLTMPNGEEYSKICFWLKNEELITRLEILMQNKRKVSQGGKNQWANNIGQFCYHEGEPTYEWWKPEGQQHAYGGQETLINFIRAWANVASGDEVYLETIDKIVAGDLTELKECVKSFGANKVRVLVGVKDGKYQSVYTKYFGRVKPQRDDLFVKTLNGEYGNFNAEFPNTLEWEHFQPQLAVITSDKEESKTPTEDEDWVS